MSCTEAAMDDAADLIESLQAQLAESQRREQAAVEAIKRASDYCGIHFNPCEAECSLAPWCKWRGPQEAGKGEAG
jgi:hypothetical protein